MDNYWWVVAVILVYKMCSALLAAVCLAGVKQAKKQDQPAAGCSVVLMWALASIVLTLAVVYGVMALV